MHSATVYSTERVAGAVSIGLRRKYGHLRNAVKLAASLHGFDPRAFKNWFEGLKAPHSAALVKLMYEVDEVAQELSRLSPEAERRTADRLQEIERRLGELVADYGEVRRGLVETAPHGLARLAPPAFGEEDG